MLREGLGGLLWLDTPIPRNYDETPETNTS
jgi:hypothetical protein